MTFLDIPGHDLSDASEAEVIEADVIAQGEQLHRGQWRLARVEVLNWGTFNGLYRIDVARQGHLFTGASGSGKSSLLDAIATVLTPDKWLRFNAAAQDASTRNDDRSLVSYVRGAWSKEADEHEDRAVSTYLRKGATWTGILLRYENGNDAQSVTLARLFHLRGSSVDRNDLKDLCFIDRSDVTLLDFEQYVKSGIEARRVKAAWPDATVTTTGTHATFYTKLQRQLGIGNKNALHLLHKTQSAKNLGSLDQLFRDYMLDEPVTFARAKNAVEQFAELHAAHQHVVELHRQTEHLRTLETSIHDYETAAAAETEAERLSALIDPFQDRFRLQIADGDRGLLRSRHARAQEASDRADAARAESDELVRSAERRAMQLGGSDAEQLQGRLADAIAASENTVRRWQGFADQLASVGIDVPPADGAEFAELRDSSRRALEEAPPAAAHEHKDNQQFFSSKTDLERIDRELAELRNRKSNLPAALLLARRVLAHELGLSEAALPFAGELIEVLPEYAEWTGAIERVLHPLASALLVRDEYLRDVRRHVEKRHLGTRLVFEAVPAVARSPRAARNPNSLLHRVRVSEGGFQMWLLDRLASEFDVACVDHPDELDGFEKAVTIGGQVKKSARRYEKNDRHTVDDRRQWILGADNEAKVELLLAGRREAEASQRTAAERLDRAQAEYAAIVRRRTVFESVLRQDWAELDRTAADDRVRARRTQLNELTSDNAPLQEAIAARDTARECFAEADDVARLKRLELDQVGAQLADVEALIATLTSRVRTGSVQTILQDADANALEARYRGVSRKIDRANIGEIGRKVSDAIHRESNAAQKKAGEARSIFVDGAGAFKRNWPAASGDLTTSIDDRGGYRALLEGITTRGLPEHEGNFLKLLRDKSRDLIGHLLSDIRDAPKQISDRIDPVNSSLGRSRFDVERYLRIEVKVRRAPEVMQFMADLKSVVDGAWADDDLESAERRFAVLNQIMQRLASGESADVAWRRRCLDTREHVTFMAHEIDLAGRVVNVHDSSAGLSGGQRQKLVIFCLAAALRYQLASDQEDLPSYATIILDEAFDKADSRFTRMAMDVFVEFGFHMILATPEKLLQTIEPYVGAVTSITNPSRKESRTASVVFRVAEGGQTVTAGVGALAVGSS